MNSQAAVISDRNVGNGSNDTNLHSIWTEEGEGIWKGSVAFNDNHVDFRSDHIIPTVKLGNVVIEDDNLFSQGQGPTGKENEDTRIIWQN